MILILATALVVPPLMDWEAYRSFVDDAISRATGTEARTEGRTRLLPSPRIRLDRLRLGSKGPDAPSVTADFVWSEIALTPLLRGEMRFLETRIGRADIRVLVAQDGSWRISPDRLAGAGRHGTFAVEHLVVAQLLLDPGSGHRPHGSALRRGRDRGGPGLAGPWRAEGTTRGVPFRLLTGEFGADRTMAVARRRRRYRSALRGRRRLALDQRADGTAVPTIAGRAKLLFGPPAQADAAGATIPVNVEAAFKASGNTVELEPVTIEAGEGGSSMRLSGTGVVRLDEPRLALKLDGRRLDVDSLLLRRTGADC